MAHTILLVDTDRLFLEQTRQRLQGASYRVLCAHSQAEAEMILERSRPDVLSTEVRLERPDAGFGLAWSAKRRYADLPVLIVSNVTWRTGLFFNLSRPEDHAWIRADAFLDKPIRNEELESAIRQALAGSIRATA